MARDGTAEPVSQDQILRCKRGQGKVFIFSVQQTTSRVGNLTRLIDTLLYMMTIHTYLHAVLASNTDKNRVPLEFIPLHCCMDTYSPIKLMITI